MAGETSKRLPKFRWVSGKAQPNDTARRSQQGLWWWAALAILSVAIAGGWSYHAVREALHDVLSDQLPPRLKAHATVLTLWIQNETELVQSLAEQQDLPLLAAALEDAAEGSEDLRAALRAAPESSRIRNYLEPFTDAEDDRGFALVSRSGLVLSASDEGRIGRHLSRDGLQDLARALRDEAFVTRPYFPAKQFDDGGEPAGEPRLAAVAPIRSKGKSIVGALFLEISPWEEFAEIFSLSPIGKTDDTYAFDANGLMLSNSRHVEQLKRIGLIPDKPGMGSVLRVQVRDPGGNLASGFSAAEPPQGRPLTRVAAAAVANQGSGILLTPYRDYRGVDVIGAWHWLPEFGVGLVTEREANEAFQVLRPVKLAFVGLFSFLVLSVAVMIPAARRIYRLRNRIEEITRLGQYALEQKIGEGGMGSVYLARHALLQRPTAIKLVRSERISEADIARFEQEVRLNSELTHPNTVEIYDFGRTGDGIFYYVMEYLPGIDLAGLIESQGAISSARVIYILRQLCASLAEAHRRGLVHRDIKPLNVYLTERGGQYDFVKVLDFGLVKDVSGGGPQVTSVNEVPGTPPYIAPERLLNPRIADPRCDIFSVGAVAFNLLTGRPLFDGDSAMDIAHKVVASPAPRLGDFADVPLELERLVLRCLSREPAERPEDANVLCDLIDELSLPGRWGQPEAKAWWAENATLFRNLDDGSDSVSVGNHVMHIRKGFH